MSNTSPAHSSVSTLAIAGGGAGGGVGGGGGGGGGGSGSSVNTSSLMEDFHIPSGLITIQDSKDEAMLVLKTDLKAALDEEVKSLDENNWMFEAPRSRIHLLSRPGVFLEKKMGMIKNTERGPKRMNF